MKLAYIISVILITTSLSAAAAPTVGDHGLNPTLLTFKLDSDAARHDHMRFKNLQDLAFFMFNPANHNALRILSHQNNLPYGFDVAYTGASNILTDYLETGKFGPREEEFLRQDLAQIIYVCQNKPT